MKKAWLLVLGLASSPALATGGMVCRTAGANPIVATLGIGHVAGSPIVSTSLSVGGRNVPVIAPQYWLDDRELRLRLTDRDARRTELLVKVFRNGRTYDGNAWRAGRRHWIRCRDA